MVNNDDENNCRNIATGLQGPGKRKNPMEWNALKCECGHRTIGSWLDLARLGSARLDRDSMSGKRYFIHPF